MGIVSGNAMTARAESRAHHLTGLRIGRLTVLAPTGAKKRGHHVWLCRCDCGSEAEVTSDALTSKRMPTRSCGCLHRERAGDLHRTHGKCGTPTYRTWTDMISRCENRARDNYARYGGRGIRVCERWRNSFEAFLSDMGERPVGKTIDRVASDGNYEPGNCQWATAHEQGANKRNNIAVERNGVTRTLAEWSRLTGLNRSTLYNRARRGVRGEALFRDAAQ